ncbi:MAG: FAD:protein FMN transferase, partial [Pseudomonadota bacterium]|nr:FAD:protein FMN transferase [Pseudomonadota bacterium]
MTAASVHPPTRRWSRRARPLLGTLVEIGTPLDAASSRAVALGFGAIEEVQACLSRFENRSDIARFNAMDCGAILTMRAATAEALCAAADLRRLTAGLFDISLGTAVDGWQIDGERLVKRDARTRLDLGGIGKGLAVDRAVQALRDAGVADGWVNAGGDLRAFGAVELP